MSEFLKEFNDDPSLATIDSWWKQAGDQSLHNSVMLFGKIALSIRKKQVKSDSELLPEATRLLHQLSISGYYTNSISDQETARWAADLLCIHPGIESIYQETARSNQLYYAKKIEDICHVYQKKELKYKLDIGWSPNNPSITLWNNDYWMIQRTVNYSIREDGSYQTKNNGSIRTRNFLVKLNPSLSVTKFKEISLPDNWGDPVWNLVEGFEDCRLFVRNNELWCSTTVREKHPSGLCQIYLMKIENPESDNPKFSQPTYMPGPNPQQHQKNWMPLNPVSDAYFVYTADPTLVIDRDSRVIISKKSPIAAENFRGGGQVIGFGDGYLAIVHESIDRQGNLREYIHRFIWFDEDFQLKTISPRFKINGERIEFAAGLTTNTSEDRIIVSYGANDGTSWLIELDADSVKHCLSIKATDLTENKTYISPNGPIGPVV